MICFVKIIIRDYFIKRSMIHHFAYLIAFYFPVNCRWAKLNDTMF